MTYKQLSQQAVTDGLKTLEQGNELGAVEAFRKGLNYILQVEAPKERRNLLSEISQLFANLRLVELARDAVLYAIQLDEELNLPKQSLTKDYITYGTILYQMGNIDQAKIGYEKAIELSLHNQDYGNAASASTNLAFILGHSDLDNEAIDLLRNSLDYLTKVNFPDTDMKTRLLFAQFSQRADVKPQEVIDVTSELSQYSDSLHSTEKDAIRNSLEIAIERRLEEEPPIDPHKLRMAKFSWLFS